jgi:hypothetical protein
MGEPGHPLLPFKAVNFVIPRDKVVASVELEPGAKHRLSGQYFIYPAQADWLPSGGAGGFTWPDPSIYGSADPYPGTAAGDGHGMVAWGWNTYQLKVWPLEYIPAKRELWLYETVHIWLELVDGEAQQEVLPRSQEQHEEWAQELEQAVANPQDVWTWAPEGAAISGLPRRWVLILPGQPEQDWYNAFSPLISWREQQGLTVVVEWAENISPSHDYQEIRSYLQSQHTQGARWVLLAGDDTMVPWYEWPSGSPTTPYVPTDWCYCDLDDPWPPEEPDWAAELLVGRVPCVTPGEGSSFVGKALVYEEQPGYGSYAYLDSAFYNYSDVCQNLGTCDSVITHEDNAIRHVVFGEEPSCYAPDPWFPTSGAIVTELNRSRYHYVTIHNSAVWRNPPSAPPFDRPDSFACLTDERYAYPEDLMSAFGPNEFASLTNTAGYYQFWYSISCVGAQLDWDPAVRSRAEMAVCSAGLGAVAYAGNTRVGHWWYSTDLQCAAWDLLFPQGPYREGFNQAGSVEANSKWLTWRRGLTGWSYDYRRYTHNLFGDPATGIWCPKARPGARKPLTAEDAPAPLRISWLTCRPNPAETHALLRFGMSRPAEARVGVYDIAGRLVEVVYDGEATAGTTTCAWNCARVPAGVYTVRIGGDDFEAAVKAVVVK